MAAPQPPLILCMENLSGEEVSLRIEPEDDFQTFLIKAKSLLGFDVDLNSITRNQPVALHDNIYQFLLTIEQNLQTNPQISTQGYEQIIEPNENGTNDLLYILDDGTQIKASQIHFDNEDPHVDLTAEKIPFVKYVDDGTDDIEAGNIDFDDIKNFDIVGSPVSHWSSQNSSPKCSFINSLPFKLVYSNAAVFEAQFTKYLEESNKKTYATLNLVANTNKSPRSVIKDNFKIKDDTLLQKTGVESTSLTREAILALFKDPPVATKPYVSNYDNDKGRHVRKTDPSRPVHKNRKASSTSENEKFAGRRESDVCCICSKFIGDVANKLYFFDYEDQRLSRCSPTKKVMTQLKIICEICLTTNFTPSRLKNPEQSLNPDEYVVIENNQQYIFKKTFDCGVKKDETLNYSNNSTKLKIEKDVSKKRRGPKGISNHLTIEINPDGEIIAEADANGSGSSDDVIIVNDDKDDSSSDVEIIEPAMDIDDHIIDNLEDADDEVREFLGKYQTDNVAAINELKCRFCEMIFDNIQGVIDHGEVHKHESENEPVFPCPLCDYGYANSKWLKGHLKAAHQKISASKDDTKDIEDPLKEPENQKVESPSKETSPIAKRTRSSRKKFEEEKKEEIIEKLPEVEIKEETTTIQANSEDGPILTIKTEVKQESLDTSDEEAIWIVQTADDDNAEEKLRKMLRNTEDDEYHARKCLKPYRCSNCSQKFTSLENKLNHRCRRRGRRPKLQEMDATPYLPNEDNNLNKVERKPHLPCEWGDDDLLMVRPRKRRHRELTSDPVIVTCHNCNESFTSKVRLKFHLQFHEETGMLTDEGRYNCTECEDMTFGTETELFDHVHFQHVKQKRWQCDVEGCGKTFFLRATLTKHSRTHTDTRRYVCVTCGKRFLDKQTLDEHGVTHLRIKPYQCHVCMKQLTRRSRLRMHLRAHEEELHPKLVLVCAVCSRAFRDNIDAQEHAIKYPECIENFAKQLKKETDDAAVQLSPTSGVVKENKLKPELILVSKDIPREAHGKEACELLAQVSDESRSIIRVVIIEKAFRCEYCEDVFYLEDGLNGHRMIHKEVKNPFTCHICKVSFATYSRCTTHKTTHGFYKRSLADAKKDPDNSGMKPSMRSLGPSAIGILGYGGFPVVKHFLCEDCGRSYLHWTYLQVHRRMKHVGENLTFKCSICGTSFPSRWSLTYHNKKEHAPYMQEDMNVALGDYKIPCRDCEECLPNKTALYKHRKENHSNAAKPKSNQLSEFRYNNCNLYDNADYLEERNKTEHREGSTCVKCGVKFTQAGELQRHLMINHHGEFDFPCDSCDKTFHTSAELIIHAHAHKRPYACTVCGHTFRTASMRNEHLRIHTGERPFPCDVCGVAFKRSTAMRNHRLIHTGIRAWACGRCPKRFRIRSDLRNHLRNKHPAYLAVIEMEGLNPRPEEVTKQLLDNDIPQDKVLDVTKMSFTRGSVSLIPDTYRALSLLSHVPKIPVEFTKTETTIEIEIPDEIEPPRRGRGIAKNPRRPKILQRGVDHESMTIEVPAEELTELNVQMLLRDGVIVDGNQMVEFEIQPTQM